MLISIMKKFTNGRDLIRPGMTRFATTYLTLACLHELKASLNHMGDTLKTAIQTKQDLYTNSYKITINWGTIQVLENVFYTKCSHIRRLTNSPKI